MPRKVSGAEPALGLDPRDAAKKILGRKRHLAVDSDGRLLAVSITPADIQDQDGGIPLVQHLVRLCPWIETVVVDGAYKARFIEAVQNGLKRLVEVVKDRKSTRLNSSHANISYAVFCLKKKKTNIQAQSRQYLLSRLHLST